jgi:hypothetical protein
MFLLSRVPCLVSCLVVLCFLVGAWLAKPGSGRLHVNQGMIDCMSIKAQQMLAACITVQARSDVVVVPATCCLCGSGSRHT